MEDWESRITIEPGKKRGFPCIRGMRISVRNVMECFECGMTEHEILHDFPYLEREDLDAARRYAARYGTGPSNPWSAFAGDRLR
jgi:uncharacterized protein (DUF433 family)